MANTNPAADSPSPYANGDLLYGVRSIAQFLGLPEKPCRHRIEAGTIPSFKMGGTVCARRSSLMKWLAKLERAANG